MTLLAIYLAKIEIITWYYTVDDGIELFSRSKKTITLEVISLVSAAKLELSFPYIYKRGDSEQLNKGENAVMRVVGVHKSLFFSKAVKS